MSVGGEEEGKQNGKQSINNRFEFLKTLSSVFNSIKLLSFLLKLATYFQKVKVEFWACHILILNIASIKLVVLLYDLRNNINVINTNSVSYKICDFMLNYFELNSKITKSIFHHFWP